MKKISIMVALLVAISNCAFAAAGALSSGAASDAATSIFGGVDATAAAAAPTALIRFSTGVNGVVVFTNNTGYLVATKHSSGSKIFATTNSATNIYWKQAQAGLLGSENVALGIDTPDASNLVGNGWTSY